MARDWIHRSLSGLVALFLAGGLFTGRAAAAPEPPLPAAGWRLELVAQSPAIRHPSVVCAAPDGKVFVAEDPMDISAPADAKQGRIVCFHPDGRRTVFAEGLHAVFGMQYFEGRLYVLHNPFFTVFNDQDGVGQGAVTLIEQTLPKPWALQWNDHVPANFQLARDGFFYIAVGDKGICGAVGRDGRRVDLHGGGILRMRPDGTELEVYSTGVRNILDVALDADDELFTYDNTDEHDWMGRLTHMVDGGFYGYPHDFIPRRPYTLWMMHDFGAGAATGALAYNEDALPQEYHGNLFLADFGKRQVTRVVTEREGATYRVVRHEELFKNVPDDFRPVGLGVSADGSAIYICDWQHRDTKEAVQTGRLWKLTWAGPNQATARPGWFVPAATGKPFRATDAELIEALGHPSRAVRLTAQRRVSERRFLGPLTNLLATTNASSRAREHAVWALDAIDGGVTSRSELNAVVTNGPAALRRAAIRQAGQRRAGASFPLLSTALKDDDATIRFQAATALGRIADSSAVPGLLRALDEKDSVVRFAVFTALNRIGRANPGAWNSIASGLHHGSERVREGTGFALRETYDATLVDVLAGLVSKGDNPAEVRLGAAELLAALHHRTPEWKGEWWAYHPALAPAPRKTVSWKGTDVILASLRKLLDDAEPRMRRAAVDGIRSAADTNAAPRLRARFDTEADAGVRRAILETLGDFGDKAFASSVVRILGSDFTDPETTLSAVRAAARVGDENVGRALMERLGATTNAPLRAEIVQALAALKTPGALERVVPLASDSVAVLRQAAQRALVQLGGSNAFAFLRPLLTNSSVEVRTDAIGAIGTLRDRKAVPDLLVAWRRPETRGAALDALTRVSDEQALDAYLEALASGNPTLREQARKALNPIRDSALPQLEARVETLPGGVVRELRQVYSNDAQAKRGRLFSYVIPGPDLADYERHALQQAGDPVRGQRIFFDQATVACIKCHAVAGHGGSVGPDLTLVGAQFPRAALIEHILQPSKAVREGYQQFTIETRDGNEVSGILKGETAEAVTLMDANDRLVSVPKTQIASRVASGLSLMPEGLHVGLTVGQFADLIAYLESRRTDPVKGSGTKPLPENARLLFDGRTLDGWRELPPGTKRVDIQALRLGRSPEHWLATNGILEHDGMTGDLWNEQEFGDFELHLEWRWPDPPRWEVFPLINSAGVEGDEKGYAASLRVLDAGDSGVLLRGLYKAQANLFCYPVGSGEVWEYRTDPSMTPEQRRAVTPRQPGDRPVGDWNEMLIRMRGERLSVTLNGRDVIAEAQLPGVPERGPVGFQHEHGRIQFRNIWIRELK